MLKSIFLLHGYIFILIKSNPLRGFPLYPVIQENYGNEQRIVVLPSDINSYSHPFMIQNQITPYQNNPISYNEYAQRSHLANIFQSPINVAVDANDDQNYGQIQRFVNPADILLPNVVNNYIIVPVEYNSKNKTGFCDRANKTKSRLDNIQQKKNCKCRKRKNTTRNTCEKGNKIKRKCPRDLQNNQSVDNELSNQSSTRDVKVCRKNKSKHKPQKLDTQKEKENWANSERNWTTDKKSNSRCRNNQNSKKKYSNINDDVRETGKRVKSDKNKTNNCRKVVKEDNAYDFGQIMELDDYFNINENCAELDNRCTRNYKDESIQKYQPQYHPPNDFSNHMPPYRMFNRQLFDTGGYFPYNFDYLYNMQQFPKENSNASQKKSRNNRRTGRRKKQRKSNKNNSDRNKQDSKKSRDRETNVELPSTFISVVTDNEPTSTVTAKPDETQIEKSFQNDPENNKKETIEPLDVNNDSKDVTPNDYSENVSPVYDDYYPEFHSDTVYTSKEYDWNEFHDRNYYSSGYMSELDRERRKYDSTDDIPIPQQETIKLSNLKPLADIKKDVKEIKDKEPLEIKLNSYTEGIDVKLKTSSEEIQFKTPPALNFPGFKTKMINKDRDIPKIEIYYQPNNKLVNKYEKNKMSSYSNTKIGESNENRNRIVDQNDVETVFGHSRVVKYGVPPKKEEEKSDIKNNDSNNSDPKPKGKNSYSSDGKTTYVIAKSLPYPIT